MSRAHVIDQEVMQCLRDAEPLGFFIPESWQRLPWWRYYEWPDDFFNTLLELSNE